MDVGVFASCNTLKGYLKKNVLRFRPYVFHFKEYTREEFIETWRSSLVEREGVKPHAGSEAPYEYETCPDYEPRGVSAKTDILFICSSWLSCRR